VLERVDKKLIFSSLDFEILIGDLYEKCESEQEIEWLQDQLSSIVECLAEERMDEIN
jgi:hypothetical protein